MKKTFPDVHKAVLKFLIPLSLRETYRLIAEEARKLVKAGSGSILIEENGELVKVYAYPEILYQVKNRKKGFMYRVFSTQKPTILNIDQFASIHPFYQRIKVKTSIGIPLTNRNKAIGVLTLHSKKDHAFDKEDIVVLELFASFATLAIRKAQLYDELEMAVAARDHFISMAAHELRTPLTTINGYIQLLHSKLSGANTSESKWVKELSWEVLRLIQLINELLAVDQIKTGDLNYFWKDCPLTEVIKRAIRSFQFSYPEHKIVFEDKLGNESDNVIGDFDKLLQALTNLLDNAAKFSPLGSTVAITLESKNPSIILSIKNEGPGIPKKDLSKIFDRFYKGQNHKREGMGLGLYLVKKIIAEHKGKIKIISKKEKGVVVQITLPEIKNG